MGKRPLPYAGPSPKRFRPTPSGGGWSRWLPMISTGVGLAAAGYQRWKNGPSRNGRSRDYGNITFQNDEQRLYRRKRAPRRMRKRMRKSFKRFTYFLDKVQGMRTAVFTRTQLHGFNPTDANTAQGVFGVTLYGYGSNSSTPGTNTNHFNGDIRYIFTAENSAAPTGTLAASKLRFRSAVLDLNIKNTLDPEETNARGAMVYVDVYHVLCRANGNTSTGTGDPGQAFQDAVARQGIITNTNAVTSNQTDGVTPFSAPDFGSEWIIKRVRRVRLSSSQSFSTQLRDPGNYTLDEYGLLNFDHKRNLTEGYVCVFWNPSADASTGIRGAFNLEVNVKKSYHYSITETNDDVIGRSNLI